MTASLRSPAVLLWLLSAAATPVFRSPACADWSLRSDKPGETAFCPWVERGPDVDGDLKEWAGEQFALKLDQAHLSERIFYNPLVSGGDGDCSGEVALAWAGKFLYVAVKARDDMPSPIGEKGWRNPWEHDGLLLYVHAHSGLELSGRYGREWRRDPTDPSVLLGLNYHASGETARPLPGESRYAARPVAGGYQIEAAVDLKALGYLDPRPGDRLKMALILVDVDPGAPGSDSFGQLVAYLPAGGEGANTGKWADLRLLRDGWGGEVIAVAQREAETTKIGVKVSMDALRNGVVFKGVRVTDAEGKVVLSAPAQAPVSMGERLTAATVLDATELAEGAYSVHLVAEVAGGERNGDAGAPVVLHPGGVTVEYPKVIAVEDPARFQWRQLPPSTKYVSKDTYLTWLLEHGRKMLAPLRGNYERPWRYAHYSGFLAAYLYAVTQDPFYADMAKRALESAMRWAETQDDNFDFHAAYHYLMAKFMRESGLIPPELEPRVKAYLVKSSRLACYGNYDWEANPWRRGSGHSALGPAAARFYALHFYPESLTAEEKATFARYFDLERLVETP